MGEGAAGLPECATRPLFRRMRVAMPEAKEFAMRQLKHLLRAAAAAAVLAIAACGTQQTGVGLQLVSSAQVDRLALKSWQQIRDKETRLDDPAKQRAARQVAMRLLRADGHDPAKWNVVVFKGDQANAFALPGGKIGIYDGMMKLVDGNDAELAAVLGHEVSHNDAGHVAERINSQMVAELGVNLAAVLVDATERADSKSVAMLLGVGTQFGILLPFSRNQELEADRRGLFLMARAGYDPRAAVDLWTKMSEKGGSEPPVFLSTHPGHGQRIDQFKALMPQALAIYHASGRGPGDTAATSPSFDDFRTAAVGRISP